jgi:uridylate kinase
LTIVIKLGGHLFFNENIEISLIKAYNKVFHEIAKKEKIVIVVGGGGISRKYISVAREMGLNEALCDEIGIYISRMNAYFLTQIIGEIAYPNIAENLQQVRQYLTQKNVVITGGFQPGQSTTAVAAIIAEALKAKKLIIATDVDGVYTKDPKKYPNAKLIKKITPEELSNIIEKEAQIAGEYKLFDKLSLIIIKRSKIDCIVINGKKIENIKKALRGKEVGTLISDK